MDPATIVGIVLAFGAIFGSMILEGGNPVAIMLPAPLLLVFVGIVRRRVRVEHAARHDRRRSSG